MITYSKIEVSGIEMCYSKPKSTLKDNLITGLTLVILGGFSVLGLYTCERKNRENEGQIDSLVNHAPRCIYTVEKNQGFDAFSERHIPKELRQRFHDENSRKAVQQINHVPEGYVTQPGDEMKVPCLIKEHHPEYWGNPANKYPESE